MNKDNIANFRENYQLGKLQITDVDVNPIVQFEKWWQLAVKADVKEPNAMTLATADANGRPSARIVLLKGLNEKGFVFYTNYKSRKGQDLAANPQAALVFAWLDLERQVRIEGQVEKITAAESAQYFHSRPKGSQIGAWSSPQSQVITDRTILTKKVEQYSEQFKENDTIPLPDFWGGYRLIPDCIEFWQGRTSRLHDRLRYTLKKNEAWKIERLAP